MATQFSLAPDEGFDRRFSVRRDLQLYLEIESEGGRPQSVCVQNISDTGFLAEATSDLSVGQLVSVRISRQKLQDALVSWIDCELIGLSFQQPLTTGELSELRLRGVSAANAAVGIPTLLPRERAASDAVNEKLPLPTRLRIIVALGALPWVVAGVSLWYLS